MPFVTINESPLAPGTSPVSLFYRDEGGGRPLVFLHGGWGYGVYPFDRQINAFGGEMRILIPDRTGYGRSTRIKDLPADFHRRASIEMMRFLDALDIKRAVLWGHSDGAVIAAMMGLNAPSRFAGIILEAFHFYRVKPGSSAFFEAMAENPETLGERVSSALSSEHGEDYWRELILINGRAWLKIAQQSASAKQDLYEGRLGKLQVPALFIHGSRDPRTEPGEMEAVAGQLPDASVEIINGGGHSPHSESFAASESNRVAGEFLKQILHL